MGLLVMLSGALLSWMDTATTWVVLRRPAAVVGEANPVIAGAIGALGLVPALALRLVVGVGCFVRLGRGVRKGSALSTAAAPLLLVVTGLVVVSNCYAIERVWRAEASAAAAPVPGPVLGPAALAWCERSGEC